MSAGQWIKKKWRIFYLKIVREKASPEYIARGWSIGMFFGCLIPIGGQLFCSIPTAFLLRGSKIGAVLGTFLTNQITVFFIYPVQCYAGAKLIGLDLTYSDIKIKLKDIVNTSNFQEFVEATKSLAGDLTLAFFVGGAIMAVVLTPITYVVVKKMVVGYRIQLEKRRRKRLAALRARVQARHEHDEKHEEHTDFPADADVQVTTANDTNPQV